MGDMKRVTVTLSGDVESAEVEVTSFTGATARVPARVLDPRIAVLEFESPFVGDVKARPIIHYADGSVLREVKE